MKEWGRSVMNAEYHGRSIDDAQLESWAQQRARALRPDRFGSGRREAALLRRTLRELARLHKALSLKWEGIPAMPPAVRWLLDNDYLARREGMEAVRALGASRELRCAGERTVLLQLWEGLLEAGPLRLTEQRMARYLTGFQRALSLEWAELGQLGAGLRCTLLLRLPRLYRAALADAQPPELAREAEWCITALRKSADTDFAALAEAVDPVEAALREDPAGVYARMTETARADYRRQLARLARRHGLPETLAAKRVLSLARSGSGPQAHVGWWLYRAPLGHAAPKREGRWYPAAIALATLALSLLAAFATHSALSFPLLLLPVSELVKSALDFLLSRHTPPRTLPRLALEDGLPPEGRSLCVISALLCAPKDGPALARRLEECALLSRDCGPELRYALLADLPDADEAQKPGEDETLRAAAQAVEDLNRRWGGGFYLLTRPRTETREGRWCGWERKRGALLETMRLLRGRPSGVQVAAGDAAKLDATRFLLTLDSDSRLSPGAARSLVGALLHPLNAPVLDQERGMVREGYGILSPRLGLRLADAVRSDFSRVFAGQGGVDPYEGAAGELYMDRWDCGGFAGKGLIQVDAFLACMDGRVPENCLLSHDAVEGAFLRAGYAGDVELSDGFPGRVLPWYARQDRWVRGDWQNLPWLLGRGRGLPALRRWRLFDSLRRSLVPVASYQALLAGFLLPGGGMALAAAVALAALLTELLLLAASAPLRQPDAPQRPFSPALFLGMGGALARTLLRLLLLPAEAFCSGAAIVKALWRMLVSRRKLLEWQTAAQAEQKRAGLWGHYLALWPAPLTGLSLLILAPGVIGKAAGLLWIFTPASACLLSLPNPEGRALRAEERDYLLGCASDTWRYFDDFMTAAEHGLPPDNHQYRPPTGTAHRTSPTNIGLGLLSLLAALDLELTERGAALDRIARGLETLEALPKWRGHLYNWYQTETLEPLRPRYVSTVDSGNLCACLLTLRAGLRELGEDALARRADALAAAMGFAPLYDRKRRLLHIGYDPETGQLSEGHYDLLSSEARLTAYLAVARGDVPRECWQRLSRAQLAYRRRRGMASWTGTMFEYLMPELLLPLIPHSLLHESARYCLYVQRRRAKAMRAPWGCSESAYAALDSAMSYRYKAHGCAGLALRRGMDEDFVVSPYSSFLALPVAPGAALRNLRRLEGLGLRGRWGFWEALDLSPGRAAEGGAVLRCVMAHHQGMSLVAADNALCSGAMQRRFLADPAMDAYRQLLEEKTPWSVRVLRRSHREQQSPPPRPEAQGWSREGVGTDFLRPRCCLLAGDHYSLLFAETGLCRPRWGRVSPYVPGLSPLDLDRGMDFRLWLDGQDWPLLPAPDAGEPLRFRWRFTDQSAELAALHPRFRSSLSVRLSRAEAGERRSLRLLPLGSAPEEAALHLRFRPLLAEERDYFAQPAFAALGLSARIERGCLLIRRLPRGRNGELWLCLAATLPLRAELGPGPDSGRAGEPLPVGAEERFLNDALVTVCWDLPLTAQRETRLDLAFALAHSAEEALDGARRILDETGFADLPRRAAAVLGLDAEAAEAAMELLSALCFPVAPAAPVRREELWRFGISGDRPIVCARFRDQTELDWARQLLDCHLFLCGCGQDYDLVFLTPEGGAYQTPLRDLLERAARRSGEEALLGRGGGVHLIAEGEGTEALRAAAAACPEPGDWPTLPRQTAWRAAPLCPPLRGGWREAPGGGNLPAPGRTMPDFRWDSDGGFRFRVRLGLPPRAWQNVLSNGRLSWLAADSGCGNLWDGNARENPLSPWPGLAWGTEGPERLLLETPEGLRSLFAGDREETLVRYRPGTAEWLCRRGTLTLRLTAFIPPETDVRVFLLSCTGETAGCALHWQTRLQLCPDPEGARFCRCRAETGLLRAENPRSMAAARPFLWTASGGIDHYTFSRASAEALRYDGAMPQGEPVFAARLPLGVETVLVCGCDAPEQLRALSEPEHAKAALRETRRRWDELSALLRLESGWEALDRLANGWLAYQTLTGRLLGRSSLYQNGGAFGFRDQLQDAVNLIVLDGAPARAQILRCCAHQYAEGDVQHWWHEGDAAPKGVRTRCSDDLLWLPWAVAEYLEKTGDASLLGETAPFLRSEPLRAEERDRYETAVADGPAAGVAEHCRRALALVMQRGTGPHGLLWIGSGDWNDGFDRVAGESVWLSWFFLLTAEAAAPWLEPVPGLRDFCAALAEAADRAWDGDWYLRGYFADGKPLGSRENKACRIDSIAQSFAALSGRADPEKVSRALRSAVERLHDREHRLVRLFTPPFTGAEEDPGYLVSYGPGFRENGGQYTHGALWLVLALLRTGAADQAWALLRDLLPGDREAARYGAEPYVLSADVCAAPGRAGEAGWSWYTGAAGWMLRIVAEELLGLRFQGGKLTLQPRLPAELSHVDLAYRGLRIAYREGEIYVNGTLWSGGEIAV